MAPAAEAAWEAVLSIGLAMLIGHYLDKWLGTDPWFFFGMLVIGLATAFRRLLRLAKVPPQEKPPEDPS
jgi:F0F1-type ATP synthase assembly protein I